MTILEAITRVDSLKPNQFTQEEKVRWLSILDGMIYNEVISTHENTEAIVYEKYTTDTDLDTDLIVADPYAQDVYVAWLSAQIDYYNEEIARYSNDMASFNTVYGQYCAWYNRAHMPIQRARRHTFMSTPQPRPVIFDRVRVNGVDYPLPIGITESPIDVEND